MECLLTVIEYTELELKIRGSHFSCYKLLEPYLYWTLSMDIITWKKNVTKEGLRWMQDYSYMVEHREANCAQENQHVTWYKPM